MYKCDWPPTLVLGVDLSLYGAWLYCRVLFEEEMIRWCQNIVNSHGLMCSWSLACMSFFSFKLVIKLDSAFTKVIQLSKCSMPSIMKVAYKTTVAVLPYRCFFHHGTTWVSHISKKIKKSWCLIDMERSVCTRDYGQGSNNGVQF